MDEAQAGRRRLHAAAALVALAALAGCPRAKPAAPAPFRPSDLPRIDVHTHLAPDGAARAVALGRAHGIGLLVNLSGGSPGHGLEEQLAAAASTRGHVAVFCNADFVREAKAPGYGERMAKKLATAHAMGAIGLKIPKGLGLGYVGPDGKLLPVDDPGLDPLFDEAGKLGMPVLIHTGDPKAFWLPIDARNERIDELTVHPGWSYYGEPVPSWQELFDQFERRVARHPKTIFIGAHFGNDPEDPANVARMLDKYPNLYIDTAARVPEIGRRDGNHGRDRMRAFFLKYQDRVLFGTDTGVGPDPDDLMLGSTGALPPTPADVERFFRSTWRFFETDDENIETPTPIQGRWNVDGVGLPREVLAKIYAGNAERLLHVAPPQ